MSPQVVGWKAREFVDPEEVRAEIARHGFTIRVACGDSDGVYLYTVGLTEVDHPELFLRTGPGLGEGVDDDLNDEDVSEALRPIDGIQADIAKLRDFAQYAVLNAAQGGQPLGPGRTDVLSIPGAVAIPVSFEPMAEDPHSPLRSCHDLYGDRFSILTLVHLAHDDSSV